MNPSTGIKSLDDLILGLRAGDNVAWKVDAVADYESVVRPLWQHAVQTHRPTVYFRFAKHESLIPDDAGVTRISLSPDLGFERFITEVHRVISTHGADTVFIFDMFTDLARELLSERMIGNFFSLTFPHITAVGAAAYFGILRHFHANYAVQPIDETVELLLDVYRYEGNIYIHPIKVRQRHSPTMNRLHRLTDDTLIPILDSVTTTAVTHSSRWSGLQSASYRMIGMWDRRFMQAEILLAEYEQGTASAEAILEAFDRLVPQILSKDSRISALIRQYLTLPDIIDIWKHVIGSGMIGGKAVGMILARAVLRRSDPKWHTLLEEHDSFYVAADIFYQFLVQNDCWWIRRKLSNGSVATDALEEVRARILRGTFPEYLVNRFSDMLDYFGQSPIIVRSSSLAEDAFGNAFAGTYDSVFCPNQGNRRERLEEFLQAVRRVFASSLSERALAYRAKRGVLEQDEQMALLVQRVSGIQYGSVFYPQLAGVGLSLNPYVWCSEIDPEAGVARLVLGLGTRAVERTDDDYTRIVALNTPLKRPEGDREDIRKHSQKRVDYLDLMRNLQTTRYFDELASMSPGFPTHLFTSTEMTVDRNGRHVPGVIRIELDNMLQRFPIADDLKMLLTALRTAYECPVEIEFTINFTNDDKYNINLLQCRPLQIKEPHGHVEMPKSLASENILLRAFGAVLGTGRTLKIHRIIYVVPSAYGALPVRDRFSIAKLIGKITRLRKPDEDGAQMLIGPGRFGTTMPELGVPVTFLEIGSTAVLCELDTMHEGLNPDLSLGTHFFHELAEGDMLYIGHIAGRDGNSFRNDFFETEENRLLHLIPDAEKWRDTVRVLDFPSSPHLYLYANHLEQQAVLYLAR